MIKFWPSKAKRRKMRAVGISLSESFIFRSRCKFCSSFPLYPTMPISGGIPWEDVKEYQNFAKKYSLPYIKNVIRRKGLRPISRVTKLHNSLSKKGCKVAYKSMNCAHFKNELGDGTHWEGGMYCKCYRTFWSYYNLLKNFDERRTTKTYQIND